MWTLLALAACQNQNDLVKSEPDLVVQPASIDFGEVVVGHRSDIGITLKNEGYGRLDVASAGLVDLSSADFVITEVPAEVEPRSEAYLAVRYTPEGEGQDLGVIRLVTTDPQTPELDIPLVGMGVQPRIDVDPESLWFGTVEPGASYTQSFTVTAAGSGALVVDALGFGDAALAEAYTLGLPDGYAEPYRVENGLAFVVTVTFAPPDTAPWEGEVRITSNDPDAPLALVSLKGNSVDDPTVNEAPTVEILDPDHGEYFVDDQAVTLTGHASDPDEPVTRLVCAWYAGDAPVAVAMPSADGSIASVATLPAGEYGLRLLCLDTEGASGEDEAQIVVWDHEEPMEYTIAGGDSVFDWFGVDDDLAVYLDGTPIYADNDGTQTDLAPFSFAASAGQTLRIVGTDQNPTAARLDALTLHWGTGDRQALNEDVCRAASVEHPCYDPTYEGPWPGTFFDAEYVISIP